MAKIFAAKYEIIDQPKSSQDVEVFTARDGDSEEIVTITVFRGNDEEKRGAFIQEAELLQSLDHPHILTLHKSAVHEGKPYFVTDAVNFATLADWCSAKMDLKKQLQALADLAGALEYAHEQQVVHRNLTPEAVLLDRSGHIYLSGWGRSRSQEASKEYTKTGLIVGTPEYLAPEHIKEGQTSQASDIYSFGALAYHLLSGQAPFQGKLNEVLKGHLLQDAKPLAKVRPEIDEASSQFFAQLLAKDPAARPSSMASIGRRLRRLARGEALKSSSAEVIVKAVESGPTKKPNRKPLLLLFSLLIFTAIVFLMPQKPPAAPAQRQKPSARGLRRARLEEEYKVLLRDFYNQPRLRASNPQLRKPDELLSPLWLKHTVLLTFAHELKSVKEADEEELHSLCQSWIGTLDLLLRLPQESKAEGVKLGSLTLTTMALGLFDLLWRSTEVTPLDKAWNIAKIGAREERDAYLEGDNQLRRLYLLNFPWVQDKKVAVQSFFVKEAARLWQREEEKIKAGKRPPLDFSYELIRKVTQFMVSFKDKRKAALAVEKLVYNSQKRTMDERLCALFIAAFLVHAEDYIDNDERMGRIRNLAKEARRLVPGWIGDGEPPFAVKMTLLIQRLWLRRMWVFSENLFASHHKPKVLYRNRQEAAFLIHTVINKYTGKGALDYFHRPVLRRIDFHQVKGSDGLRDFLAADVKRVEQK